MWNTVLKNAGQCNTQWVKVLAAQTDLLEHMQRWKKVFQSVPWLPPPIHTHSLSFSYTHLPSQHTFVLLLSERLLTAPEHQTCPSLLILQLMIRSFKSDRAFLCLRILLWLSITYLYSTYEFTETPTPTPSGLVSSFSTLLFPFSPDIFPSHPRA